MQFIVTGTFKYIAKSFFNGTVAEHEEIGSISEIVTASSVEAARAIADQIFSNYENKYGAVANRHVSTSSSVASAETITAIIENDGPCVSNEIPATGIVCRKCGVVGVVGRGYPFSTLPASACICDDCGA